MEPAKALERYESTMAIWRDRVGSLTEEQVEWNPPEGGWSAGQICHHLSLVQAMFVQNIQACIDGEGEEKGFRLLPAIMTTIGSFPPARIKFPVDDAPPDWKPLASPEPQTKVQAIALLETMERTIRDLCEPVAGVSKRMCTKHFAAGWLSAAQWYQFAEMHPRHHLRQLTRLERALAE